MKRSYCQLFAIILICMGTLQAKTIREFIFNGTEFDASGPNFTKFGDQTSQLIHANAIVNGQKFQPQVIVNPTERSWGYFICDVPSTDIPAGGKIRLTAWVTTNNPQHAQVRMSEGVRFGGFCPRLVGSFANVPYQRHAVSVEYTRHDDNAFMSLAVGLDYSSAKTWLIVDRILFEHLADGEESIAKTDAYPYESLKLPMEIIAGQTSDGQKRMITSAEEYLKRLQDNKQEDAAAYLGKLIDDWRGACEGRLPLSELTNIERQIFNAFISCQMKPDMTQFNPDTVLLPGNTENWLAFAAQNAKDNAILLVGNQFNMPLSFQIKVDGEAASNIAVKRLHWVSRSPDCPVPMQRDDIVEISPQSIAGFEVIFAAKDLKSGSYKGKITIVPLDNAYPVTEIPYEFQVVGWRMPDDLPVWTFTFDYGIARDRKSLQFLRERRVNTFHVTLHKLDDFKQLLDIFQNVEAAGLKEKSRFFVEVWFVRDAGGWTKPEFTPWLKQLVEHFKQHGYDYDAWTLHIYDETLCDEFFQSAKAIRTIDPKVKIYSDMLPHDVAEMNKFKSVIDFWCPHMDTQMTKNKEIKEMSDALRKTGLPFHIYNCGSMPTHPLTLYRIEPWMSWLNGDDGIMFWTVNACQVRPSLTNPNYGMSYRLNGELLSSRRWDMWAAGFEDYLLLCQANTIDAAQTRRLAEEVVNSVNKPDFPQILFNARRALCEMIAASQK